MSKQDFIWKRKCHKDGHTGQDRGGGNRTQHILDNIYISEESMVRYFTTSIPCYVNC